VLLALFILGISINLARGRTPNCHCFGQLSASPVSGTTLVRNAILLVLAGLAAWYGRENTSAWPSFSQWTGFEAGLLIFVIALGASLICTWWFLYYLLQQNGRLLLHLEAIEKKVGIDPHAPALEGLPVGEPAPELRLASLDGRTVTSEMLFEQGKPVLLLFTATSCGACDALLPDVAKWQSGHADRLLVVPVSRGGLEENSAKSTEYSLRNLLLEAGRETSEAYKVTATPSAVLVRERKIASPLAVGAEEITNLVVR
jgi:thiol-disulfide isomerase/thioredoxin